MGSTERFGYEWDRFDKVIPDYETQFLKWVSPLTKADFKDKIVMDAGCGMGRNSYWPLRYGALRTISFDLDDRTLAAARRTLAEFPNASVEKRSIYDIGHAGECDIAFSIGVIHHLEHPHDAIKQMASALKPGGTLLVWVYGYEGNEAVVRYVNPIRHVLCRLPLWMTTVASYILATPLYLYVKLVPQTRPYFKQLSTFRYWHTRSIVLDQLLPKIANYWTKDESRALLEGKSLKDIRVYQVNGLSWTVIGTKE